MTLIRRPRRGIAACLALAMLMTSLPIVQARAGMVTTDRIVRAMAVEQDRERIQAFLAREDVRRQLEVWGVDPAEAATRAELLTDAEVARIAGELDQLPAGQDAAIAIASAALAVVLVLILTDLLGLTDVFSVVDPAE